MLQPDTELGLIVPAIDEGIFATKLIPPRRLASSFSRPQVFGRLKIPALALQFGDSTR